MAKIMGPNPIKLEEELLYDHHIPTGATVCDLGSGQGLTSVFLVKEYGFTVCAADLWSDPEENRRFFTSMGLSDEQIIPVKADAEQLPFEKGFFDAVVSTDSYNYFGRDPEYLDSKLLPFVKPGGYIYITVPKAKVVTVPRLEKIKEAGKQFAESFIISDDLMKEITSPMIPEEQYAEIVNGTAH